MFSNPTNAKDAMDKFPDINMLLGQITKACDAELLMSSVSSHTCIYMHMLIWRTTETLPWKIWLQSLFDSEFCKQVGLSRMNALVDQTHE